MKRIFFLYSLLQPILGIIVKEPSNIKYKYSYNIADPTTGDSKSLHEEQIGDVVSGSYTILDPDGTRRTVHYTADPQSGFKAIVESEPLQANVYNRPQLIHRQDRFQLHNPVYTQPVFVVYQGGFNDAVPTYFVPLQMSQVQLKRVLGSGLQVYKYFLPVRYRNA